MATVAAALGYDYLAQPREAVPVCPLCGVANPSTPTTDRFGCPVGVSRCVCGFAYLNPRLTAEGYRAFYQSWYRPLVGALSDRDPATIPDEAQQYACGRRLARALPFVTGRQLLDAGGSTGAVSEGWNSLQATPAIVTVLDPCVAELERARRRGFAGIVGMLETFTAPTARFDVALCVQTIDHVTDPIAALTHLHQAVMPGGWLVIDYLRGTLVVGPKMTVGPLGPFLRPPPPPKIDHPCYWTRATLTAALTAAQWTVVKFLTTETKGLLACRAA